MKICVFCASEGEMAIDGVPVCKKCFGKPETELGELKTDQQIRAALHREILITTARAHAASEELMAIMCDIPSGLPHPDGSLRIQNAARALAAARSDVMKAHSRVNDFLTGRLGRGDLKPGGPA